MALDRNTVFAIRLTLAASCLCFVPFFESFAKRHRETNHHPLGSTKTNLLKNETHCNPGFSRCVLVVVLFWPIHYLKARKKRPIFSSPFNRQFPKKKSDISSPEATIHPGPRRRNVAKPRSDICTATNYDLAKLLFSCFRRMLMFLAKKHEKVVFALWLESCPNGF